MLGYGIGLIVLGFVLLGVAVATQAKRMKQVLNLDTDGAFAPKGLVVTVLSGAAAIGSGISGVVLVIAALVRG